MQTNDHSINSRSSSAIAALFFTIMLDFLGVNILIPILPELFANPNSPHYLLGPDADIKDGYHLLGLLMGLFSIGQFFMAPIFGEISDKLGRKPILVWSILASGIGYILFALGVLKANIWLLFVARGLTGITSGNIAVAQAAIGDLSNATNRAKNFGLIGAAFGIGLIVGPFLGGVLANSSTISWFNAATPFWFAAILTLFNAIFVITMLNETHPKKNETVTAKITLGMAVTKIFHAWSLIQLRPLFITNFLFISGFIFFTSFSAVFLVYHFQYTEVDIGNYFAFLGLCIFLTQVILTRILSHFFKEEKVLSFSLFFTAFAVMGILLIPSSTYLYAVVPFFAMGLGLSMANMTALISKRAGTESQGEVLGLNSSIIALAGIFPLTSSGFIAGAFSPNMPLILSAVIMTISGFYFLKKIKH